MDLDLDSSQLAEVSREREPKGRESRRGDREIEREGGREGGSLGGGILANSKTAQLEGNSLRVVLLFCLQTYTLGFRTRVARDQQLQPKA